MCLTRAEPLQEAERERGTGTSQACRAKHGKRERERAERADVCVHTVMAKHERMRPSSRGLSHRLRCAGEPYRASTSMLPVSGAEQLNTSGAYTDRPCDRRERCGRVFNVAVRLRTAR